MTEFATEREALDFLVGRIADEAKREDIPLSDVERKMLYFSEKDWTLPGMAMVSKEFNRDYNEDEYERKVAGLIANITADRHSHNEEEEEKWGAAVCKLSDGDRYLQVLLNLASSTAASPAKGFGFFPTFNAPPVRPPHDRLKLWIAAFAIALGLLGLIALQNLLSGTRFGTVVNWVFEDRNRFGLLVILVVMLVYAPKLWRILRVPPIKK